MFFLKGPNNYEEMLNKIGWATFLVALILSNTLHSSVPEVASLFEKIAKSVSKENLDIMVQGVSVALGTVLPAIIISALFRMVRMHDKLSDLFGIRKRYDENLILIPLARRSGKNVTEEFEKKIQENRRELMNDVFYKYVTPDTETVKSNPALKHLVPRVLDALSYFWIVIEALPLVLISTVTAFSFGESTIGWVLLFVFIGLFLLLKPLYSECKRYTENEVEELVKDPAWKKEIKKNFNAL